MIARPPTAAQRLAERERPAGRAVMRQQWADLLFLHWAWDAAAVQRTLPPGLTVDTFAGRAWIGLVPFFMRGVRPKGLPAVPGLSNFLELNVRTYVHDATGRPGVWFYSLDCSQWLAVKIARGLFHLPYEHAEMSATVEGATGDIHYSARRRGAAATSRFCYRAAGPGADTTAGTLEFFLLERYRLFAWDAPQKKLWSGRVAHPPYRMGEAIVTAWDDGMLQLAGFDPGGREPDHRCTAAAVDVEVFPLTAVG